MSGTWTEGPGGYEFGAVSEVPPLSMLTKLRIWFGDLLDRLFLDDYEDREA